MASFNDLVHHLTDKRTWGEKGGKPGAIYEVDATGAEAAWRHIPEPELFADLQDGGPSWGKFTHDYTR